MYPHPRVFPSWPLYPVLSTAAFDPVLLPLWLHPMTRQRPPAWTGSGGAGCWDGSRLSEFACLPLPLLLHLLRRRRRRQIRSRTCLFRNCLPILHFDLAGEPDEHGIARHGPLSVEKCRWKSWCTAGNRQQFLACMRICPPSRPAEVRHHEQGGGVFDGIGRHHTIGEDWCSAQPSPRC